MIKDKLIPQFESQINARKFSAILTAALLTLSGCGDSHNTHSGNTQRDGIPRVTYCPNGEDFVRVQPDLRWEYTDIERYGKEVRTRTIGGYESKIEALANCGSNE